MFCAPVPLKVTRFVPCVNVPPLLVKSPATFSVAGGVNVPLVQVSVPLKDKVVVLPVTASVCAVLATVMALNVCVLALPVIACAPVVLLNTTMLDPGVNVPPLLVQSPVKVIVRALASVVKVAPLLIVKLAIAFVSLLTVMGLPLEITTKSPAAGSCPQSHLLASLQFPADGPPCEVQVTAAAA